MTAYGSIYLIGGILWPWGGGHTILVSNQDQGRPNPLLTDSSPSTPCPVFHTICRYTRVSSRRASSA